MTPRWLRIGREPRSAAMAPRGSGTLGGLNGDSRRDGAIGLASNGKQQGVQDGDGAIGGGGWGHGGMGRGGETGGEKGGVVG